MTAFVMFNKGELFANFKPEWLVVAPFLTGGIKQMSHIGGSSGVWGWGGERKRRGKEGRGGKGRRSILCCHGKLTVYLQKFYKHRLASRLQK